MPPTGAEKLIDRPRGFLNERDRKYILGVLDEELDRDDEYQQRYRIRERLKNALLDFSLFTYANPRDIALALRDFRSDIDDPQPDRISALRAMFYTLSLGLDLDVLLWTFDKGMQDAVWRGAALANDDLPYSRFETQMLGRARVSWDQLEERYERGEPLTPDALSALSIGGAISVEEADNYPNVTDDESVLPLYVPEELRPSDSEE